MNKLLITALYNLINILKTDDRCLGAWEIGSLSLGLQDEYSDVDPVLLIDSNSFESFCKDIPKLLNSICDEVILILPKTFNNKEQIRNFGTNIKIQNNIFQFDIFLINEKYVHTETGKLHYRNLTSKNILLDKNNTIKKLISDEILIKSTKTDIAYLITKYWHHIFMIIKYFKRKDYFKLVRNFDIVMKVHIDLLLSEYEHITWGGWESKVKIDVPEEKQNHLKKYFSSADLNQMKLNLRDSIEYFSIDAKEICLNQKIKYPQTIENTIKSEFIKALNLL